jgi:hypothetical protein
MILGAVVCSSCGEPPEPDAFEGDPQDAAAEVGDAGLEATVVDAQSDAEPQPDAQNNEPCTIDPQRVLDDVALLASTAWGGRAPGTPGNTAAIDYAEGVFQAAGLVPPAGALSFRHTFPHSTWRLQEMPTLSVGGSPAQPGQQFTVIGRTGSADVEAELVFVGYGITIPPYDPAKYPDCPIDPGGYDDYEGVDVSGKIVLLGRHGPAGLDAIYAGCPGSPACTVSECVWRFDYKARNAQQHGAAAMLLVERSAAKPGIWDGAVMDAHLPGFASVIYDRATAEQHLPNLPDWIDQIDATMQPASTATGLQAALKVSAVVEPISADNLIGVIPGTNPEHDGQVAMIGAHIDHLGTDMITGAVFAGADDNASGTAVVLEAARVLSSCVEKPARTLAFAIWNAEEDGLVGSCTYVNKSPTIPLKDMYAYINVDMVGAGSPGLSVQAGDLWDQTWLFDVMSGSAKALGVSHPLEAGLPFGGSDHVCFFHAGVVAVSTTSLGAHPFYHTAQDTFENIAPGTLTASAELIVASAIPLMEGNEAQYFRCEGSCKDQVHDECTCDPSDPCGWSNDGRCDVPDCEGVVDEMYDDSQDCVDL